MTDKKKVLELLQNDVLDIELKNCKATDISERITELADRICKVSTQAHGEWLDSDPTQCSLCGYCDGCGNNEIKYYFKYCPNCGAKMEMESDNNG